MKTLTKILKDFKNRKIVVIGDVMLDKTIFGDVSRISSEAPAPIIEVKNESYHPGGAANVAANISSLNGNVSLFGFVGRDAEAEILSNELSRIGVKSFFDFCSRTILKTRVRAGNQQIFRLDYEDNRSQKNFNSEFENYLEREIRDSDIILVSDYAKGAINSGLMNFLKSFKKKIIVDPKPKNMHLYNDSFLITPNEKESLEMSKKEDIYSSGRFLRENLGSNVLITRGKNGMTLFSDKEIDIPTYAREVYDVAGAGDTVVAALSLALASGANIEESAIMANHAAGISVRKIGTYQVKLRELERELSGKEEKLKNFSELSETILELKNKNKRIVWTSGCFDILHHAHVKYLNEAKRMGDYLIVGLNSDSSVRNIKGPERPINPENIRAEILSSLASVDYILTFDENSPLEYLSILKPDVYAKGGDYNINSINQDERKAVESYGGKIVFIDVGEDISTTKLIERIRKNCK